VLERGGRSYDVHATSQKTPTAAGPNCQDYHPENTSCLDLRLRDTSGLTFEVGTPPACTAGNELVPLLYVSIPYPNTFDGRITYVETRGGSLSFEADNGMKVAVSSTMGIFPEPAVGQQFWLSMDGTLVAIRTAQAGQLVVGAVVAGGSGDSTAVLGVKVTAENDCAYTMDAFGVTYLRKVVFGSTPPVTVRTGSRGLLPLGGREYHVANNSGSVVIWK
jgi:hypothetical protein